MKYMNETLSLTGSFFQFFSGDSEDIFIIVFLEV